MTQYDLLLQEASFLKEHVHEYNSLPKDDLFSQGYFLGCYMSEHPIEKFILDAVIENTEIRSN